MRAGLLCMSTTLATKARRHVMKTVIASLLVTLTVIASPAFARNGSRGAGYDQGGAYRGYSSTGNYRPADEQRIIDSITRSDWSAGK
jgi:hypothetical protein